ncbi:MAG: hypothetical protein CL829_04820 [Crocinitomicaceae bacterium]|nr:hypothetical protein [Crocinitomicaceae bacterium]
MRSALFPLIQKTTPLNPGTMSLPLNPALHCNPSSIEDLPQAHRWVERFARPQGFSPYAWNTTKRIAMEVWKCHFSSRPFQRTLNFMHPLFYQMIRTPEGLPLVPETCMRGFV